MTQRRQTRILFVQAYRGLGTGLCTKIVGGIILLKNSSEIALSMNIVSNSWNMQGQISKCCKNVTVFTVKNKVSSAKRCSALLSPSFGGSSRLARAKSALALVPSLLADDDGPRGRSS